MENDKRIQQMEMEIRELRMALLKATSKKNGNDDIMLSMRTFYNLLWNAPGHDARERMFISWHGVSCGIGCGTCDNEILPLIGKMISEAEAESDQ